MQISETFNRVLFLSFLLLGIGFLLSANKGFASIRSNPKITILQIVEHPALDITRQGIIDILKNKKIEIEFHSAQGNTALAAQIAQKFVGTSPNVMVGIGTTATQALMSANQHSHIPIVFSSVTDPKEAKLVYHFKNPEGNVTGVSNYIDPAIQFDFFKKILPNLSKIGVIYNPGEPNSVTLVASMKKIAANKGLHLILATANTTAEISQATQNLMGKVQAIFINNDNTALAAFDSIVKISTDNKIPVFCSDVDMVDRGALAAIGPDQYEIGRQTGKIILEIIDGKNISLIPVQFPGKIETHFNFAKAEKLNIKIPETSILKQYN